MYKPNRLLIMLFIDSVIILIILIASWIIFDVTIILLELTESVIIIASAHLVYKDAQRIRAGASSVQKLLEPDTWSPTSWGLAVLFFWLVMFPIYLLTREGIFWKNQQPSMDDYLPSRHYIKPLKPEPRSPKPITQGENVIFCSNCETLWSKKMIEKSPYCKLCGELLTKER